MTPRTRFAWNRAGGTTLPIRRILLAIAALLFFLAAIGTTTLGTLQLTPLGLFLLALAFLL